MRALQTGLLAAMIILSGCALQPAEERAPVDAGAATLTHWVLAGKLSVTQGKRRDFVAINRWQQDGEAFDITLSSTLFGLGAARLYGTPHQITLTQGDERYLSEQPDQLVAQTLKLPLPVKALSWWVRGLPAPDLPLGETVPAADSGSRTFLQDGWQVRLSRYTTTGPYTLPGRIDLSRGRIHIRLVITQWQLT